MSTSMAAEQPTSGDQPMPDADQPSPPDDRSPTASPPLPERPVAATPGPRATRFRQVYGQALEHTLAKLGWDNFAACYPTIAGDQRGGGGGGSNVLRQVQGQMVGKLGDKCGKEFESILATRQVVPKLNELETLIADAAERRKAATDEDEPVPPHLLPPDRILSAHLHPILAAHRSQLNARLQTTQSQNALLADEVRRQRDEVGELLARLEAAADDVRGANGALAEVVGQLAAEAREGRAAVAAAEAAGNTQGKS